MLNNMDILNFVQSNHQFKLLMLFSDKRYQTYYIKSFINNKNIWKSFGKNECGQCGVGCKNKNNCFIRPCKVIKQPIIFFEGEIYEWKFNNSEIYIKTIDKEGISIWYKVGSYLISIDVRPTILFKGEIYEWKFNYSTIYIKTINNEGESIWKSFRDNIYRQCHAGQEDRYILKPTTLFRGEIIEWKFDYFTIYIKTINNEGESIWKSFGDNRYGRCGVGKKDEYILKPTTFFEGEIYEWKFDYYTVHIKTNYHKGKTIWHSFGGKGKYGQMLSLKNIIYLKECRINIPIYLNRR